MGIIIIIIDLILLYFMRLCGEKILTRWMILLAILIGCIPIINTMIGSIVLVILLFALLVEKDFTLSNPKISKWLNGTI